MVPHAGAKDVFKEYWCDTIFYIAFSFPPCKTFYVYQVMVFESQCKYFTLFSFQKNTKTNTLTNTNTNTLTNTKTNTVCTNFACTNDGIKTHLHAQEKGRGGRLRE